MSNTTTRKRRRVRYYSRRAQALWRAAAVWLGLAVTGLAWIASALVGGRIIGAAWLVAALTFAAATVSITCMVKAWSAEKRWRDDAAVAVYRQRMAAAQAAAQQAPPVTEGAEEASAAQQWVAANPERAEALIRSLLQRVHETAPPPKPATNPFAPLPTATVGMSDRRNVESDDPAPTFAGLQ